jgi:hypothetical protein
MTPKRQARYAVVLAEQVAGIPADTLDEVRLTLEAIGEGCEMVPGSSPFWTSVAASDLILDVAAGRFVYSVDPVEKKITVKSYQPLR